MSNEDIQKTADLLKQLEPGFLPYPVFEQIARLVALPIVEFIPLRKIEDKIEVLLIARPDNDALWPGLLHTPGTVVRATDFGAETPMWAPYQRIIHDELHDIELGAPQYVGSLLNKSKRGAEQAQIYWIEVLGEPKEGKFYPVDNLPIDLMDSQKTFIAEAVRHFSRNS